MLRNRRIVCCASVWVLLAALIEENAQAKPNALKLQSALETSKTLPPSAEPVGALAGWKEQAQVRSLQSKPAVVQTSGLTALEQLKQQTQQLRRSLRGADNVSEGRFEAPGVYEFSTFVAGKSDQSLSTPAKDEEIERLRSATIQSIEKILQQTTNSNQRVELLLRLSELHAERHSALLIKEMSQFEANYAKWERNHRSGPEPKFTQMQSLQALNAATQILRNLVNQYPNHPRTHEALYQLGFLLTEMKSDSAVLYFQRLIERFPGSRFLADAQLALGEFYFSKSRFSDALSHYQKVLDNRTSRAYPYAVYKLGWTFFNMRGSEEETRKNLQKSLLAFKLLVKFAQESATAKKLQLLRKDALRDMVLVYAELGDIEEAQSYFKSLNEIGMYSNLLERLAWLHADAGRYAQAIEIYQRLLREFPNGKNNPQNLVRLAGLYEKEQQRPMLIESLEQLSELLSSRSAWTKQNASSADLASAKTLLINETQQWSLRFHAEFQKTKNKSTATQALALYDLTLRHQGETASSYMNHFNRAQLHTSLDAHEKAIEGYIATARIDKKFVLRKAETKIALENAIAESDILIQRRGPVSPNKNQSIPALELRLVQLIDTHSTLFPKDTERLGLLHRAALIHLSAGLVNQASARWVALAKEAPQSTYVSEGLRLVIKRSYDANDWPKAVADARLFLSVPGIAAQTVGAQLSKLLRVALFQQALSLEKSSRFVDAARLFLDYQRDFPGDPDAGKALINAANNQFKANRADDALKTLGLFVSKYPQTEFHLHALEMIAMTSEALGRFADSAQAYEQLAERRNNKELMAQDLAHAAGLRLASNTPQQAITDAASAIAHLKKPAEICETYKTMIDAQSLLRSTSLLSTAREAANRCQLTSPEWGLYFTGLTARLSLSSGSFAEAAKFASLTLSRGKTIKAHLQNPFAFEGLRIAGQVQLSLLEGESQKLLNRRVSNSNAIQIEFARIKTDAQSLAQQYVQLAQLGQAETSVGALYRIAEIQEGLAQILVQAPNPQGLSPNESESFRAKIEKIALPLQEEAAQLYGQALDRASEAEVLSPYTHLLKEKLANLRPNDFRKTIEVMPSPSYIAHELPINQEVKGVVDEQ